MKSLPEWISSLPSNGEHTGWHLASNGCLWATFMVQTEMSLRCHWKRQLKMGKSPLVSSGASMQPEWTRVGTGSLKPNYSSFRTFVNSLRLSSSYRWACMLCFGKWYLGDSVIKVMQLPRFPPPQHLWSPGHRMRLERNAKSLGSSHLLSLPIPGPRRVKGEAPESTPAPATTWETLCKNHPAEPSQPVEPQWQ